MGHDGLPLASVELDDLLETVATFTRNLFNRAAVAYMSAEGDNPLALHNALASVLTDAANAPELTSISVIELPRLGPLAHERHQRMTALFSELLAAGFATMDRPPPNPDTLALCLCGSVWETIRRLAAERRLHELPDALPALSHVCLSTVFGAQEAQRVTARPQHLHRPAA